MAKSERRYVQYGCGTVAPELWTNFDVSPTLVIQKIPIIGFLLKRRLNILFPSNVLKGNIVAGLPFDENSCDGLFCSHVLEHLSLNDFRTALQNSYKILKPGGIFRCIVPDLEDAARTYLTSLDNGNNLASVDFIKIIHIGSEQRERGIIARFVDLFGNSKHLWMWDIKSLSAEFQDAGFVNIRPCKFGDCEDEMFKHVEIESRFENAVAIECKK